MKKTYSELVKLKTFEDRFNYLKLFSTIGEQTFGSKRHLNQAFYTSYEWRNLRHKIITRDEGCDLGLPGYELHSDLLIHHINPIEPIDLINNLDFVLDPDNLITVSKQTHNAIHYGRSTSRNLLLVERLPGDTKLW